MFIRYQQIAILIVISLCLPLSSYGQWSEWSGNVPGPEANRTNWTQQVGANNNWNNGTIPNSTTAQASFDGAGNGRTNPIVNVNVTVNQLRFNTNAVSYRIVGSQTLTFAGTNPRLFQFSSNLQEIAAPMSFSSVVEIETSGPGNLLLSGVIGGTGGITKTGNGGTLILSAANTFTGAVTVSNGTLRVQNSHALGTTAGATTVVTGGTLSISGNGLSIAETLTIAGNGVSSGGALRNLSGTNTWSGNVTVGTGGARINSDAGQLTLSGVVSASNQNLTNGGAGATRFVTNMNLGTGQFVRDGSGTTILSNMTLTASQTRVNAGTLTIQGIVTNTGAMTIASGAALEINTADIAGGNRFHINGNFTNAGAVNLIGETGGASSGNVNGFHGIDFSGTSFTNTGTFYWSFYAPPSGGFGSEINPYYGGIRSTENIFAPYMSGNTFTNGFVAIGLSAGQVLSTYYDGSYYYLAVIPEPRTYGMLGFGAILTILGLRASRWKKNSNS